MVTRYLPCLENPNGPWPLAQRGRGQGKHGWSLSTVPRPSSRAGEGSRFQLTGVTSGTRPLCSVTIILQLIARINRPCGSAASTQWPLDFDETLTSLSEIMKIGSTQPAGGLVFRPVNPSSRPVCRAIISSSLVGITQADTLLVGREIRGPLRALASASSSRPSQAEDSQIRRRISAEFSPMPAVNTNPSMPPKTAARAPISLAAR